MLYTLYYKKNSFVIAPKVLLLKDMTIQKTLTHVRTAWVGNVV
jgi:hypothetical protein